MTKILFINACVRPESRTRRLAEKVLEIEEGNVTEVNLENEAIIPLDGRRLEFREKMLELGDISDEMFKYAKQFAQADKIVIAAPYWDLQFPALLKLYLEAITVSGVTFKYGPEGYPSGLCNAKKLIYVTTSGGGIGDFNLGYDYIKLMAQGMFGIGDVRFVSAQNLDIEGNDPEAILAEAMEGVEELVK